MVNITVEQFVFATTLYLIIGLFVGAVITKLIVEIKKEDKKEDKKEEVEPAIITCREVDND